jgi:hypothetical protein
VTTIHSLRDSRGPAQLGMRVAGAVIIAQRLLTGGRCAGNVAALRRRGDPAVRREMRNYATVEVREFG